MASTYTDLGIQLMATGEKAGTWGTLTNTNWNIMEQISGGYATQALTSGGTVTLTKNDGTTGAVLATRVWKLTGALSDNAVVTVPDSIENWWLIDNASTNAYTVQVKTVSGSGVTWATTDKGTKLLYSDGTNVVDSTLGVSTDPGGSDTQIQYNNSGAFGGDADLIWTAGTGLTINSQKELRLADTDDSAYIGFKAAGTTTSYTLTMPAAVATSNDQILTSTTGGVLSWVDNSGGTSWQAVDTTGFTAVAGEGYFCNTTSAAFTATLPASPSLGDECTFVDYAGTFDTNNLTVGRNSEKINGSAADLTVSVERAAFTLVYTDGTQGWLLKDK
tara:strand:+ start:735 stop:1730 length:996 start_codon:yes stop_codon:yes gene_type:complete